MNKRRWKWYLGGGLAALVALIYLVPAPSSQLIVRNKTGWPVGVSAFKGINSSGAGLLPSAIPAHGLAAASAALPAPEVLGFDRPIIAPRFLARYHIIIKDAQGRVRDDEWLPNPKKVAWWESLGLGPSEAWAAACSACTTTVGANRLLGIFEGGVNNTAENDGSTGAGSSVTFTVTNPMIVPGTAVFTTATVSGNCTDQGNGTCSGASYTTATSVINYDTGTYTLTYGSAPGSGHAVTVNYKQYENWTSCSLAQIAATGQGCWYIGLMVGNAGPTLSTTDTMASHSGWTEATLNSNANGGVTQTSRPIWTGTGAPSGGSDNNSASVVTYNSGTTAWSGSTSSVEGIFVVDNSGSVSTTAGTLDGEQTLASGQPIGASYTIQITATLSITAG